MARISDHQAPVRKLIQHILVSVSKSRPHALVYPLTVASNTPKVLQSQAARAILDKMRDDNGSLVEQALLVSEELLRVAMLWKESWHSALEDAAGVYFNKGNLEGMLSILEPLHTSLEQVCLSCASRVETINKFH